MPGRRPIDGRSPPDSSSPIAAGASRGAGGDPPALWISRLVHGALLGLYPRQFRDDYRADLRRAYDELARDTYHSSGLRGLFLLQLRSAGDTLKVAIIERRSAKSKVPNTAPPHRPRGGFMDKFLQDLKFALRTLTSNPGFTAIAVSALALGIGASSAIFAVVNAALLTPPPYPNPEDLVMLWQVRPVDGFDRDNATAADFSDWRAASENFAGMAAFVWNNVILTGAGEPVRLDGQAVSGDFFSVLEVPAAVGRTLSVQDDVLGGPLVAVLSHSLWQDRFAGDPQIVGSPITLDDQPVTVAGVMPAGFGFPDTKTRYWVPIAPSAGWDPSQRRSHFLNVIGRLDEGVMLEQAQAEMDTIAERLEQEYAATNTGDRVALVPLQEERIGDIRPLLLTVLAAIGFVLLIACANVANLLLARASRRQGELAVRTALGARRSRIVRQLLTESAALALAGGSLGLGLAIWGIDLLTVLIPDEVPLAGDIGLDGRVLGFTLIASLSTALLFGLAPAIQASRPDLSAALKEGGAGGAAGSRIHKRFRSLLVAAEVALAFVLLVGAGLMVRSFAVLLSEDPGIQQDNLLTIRLELTSAKYDDYPQQVAFYDEVLERVEGLPGVRSAGFITFMPMTFSGGSTEVTVENPTAPPGDRIYPVFRIVSAGYLETMGIPMRGRTFSNQDRSGTEQVAIVNEAFARGFWPGEDALDKRMKLGGESDDFGPWMTIVGVAGNVRQFAMESEPQPEFYIPYLQWGDWGFFMPRDLAIRTESDPLSIVAAVREEVRAVDPDMPLSNVQTMSQILSRSVATRRVNMLLFGSFAAVALMLASLGIYGVISYAVSQRTREIGVRMALGAHVGDVVRMVLRQGSVLMGAGIASGLAAALAAARAIESLLYGVSSRDLATFVAVPVLLAVVALVATYVPARRASKVDPVVALRSE